MKVRFWAANIAHSLVLGTAITNWVGNHTSTSMFYIIIHGNSDRNEWMGLYTIFQLHGGGAGFSIYCLLMYHIFISSGVRGV